jgi:hypothetical protein
MAGYNVPVYEGGSPTGTTTPGADPSGYGQGQGSGMGASRDNMAMLMQMLGGVGAPAVAGQLGGAGGGGGNDMLIRALLQRQQMQNPGYGMIPGGMPQQ